MMASFFQRLFNLEKKHYNKVVNVAKKVDELKDEMKAMSDEALKAKTQEFFDRHENGESLDS
ncbi:MAG: hypothetical protein RR577_05205, partial [Erysipelotrichales bacterium]